MPLQNHKILITGARGFTGAYLCSKANQLGMQVIALKSDLTDKDALKHEILTTQPAYIAHLAGISFVPSKDHEAFYRVHALGTGNLLEALSELNEVPRKILVASSATVYGNSSNPQAIEDQELFPIDHYAISKVAMEDIARSYFNRLPIIIARPFNYTGPGQKSNFLIPKLIHHFIHRSRSIELGNLSIEREFNDIEMIGGTYLSLLEFGLPSEIYNVCSGRSHSLKFVFETLEKLTQHKMDIQINSDFVRDNEIIRMIGSPSKLNQLLEIHGLSLNIQPLEYTLRRMLVNTRGISPQTQL